MNRVIRGLAFTSTVCDIEIVVQGTYEPPESDTNTPAHFSIEKVFVPSDRGATDLTMLLTDPQIARLQEEGIRGVVEHSIE
jgi:hypothetical protein